MDCNPYSPPAAAARDPGLRDAIDLLPVSDVWKDRFRLIEKAGGPKAPGIAALSFRERMRFHSNTAAMVFGPLYYVAMGMWRKAVSYLLVCVSAATLLGSLCTRMGRRLVRRLLGQSTE